MSYEWCDREVYRHFTSKAEFDKAIFTLKGLVEGICLDSKVNADEILELRNWVEVNEGLMKYKPFDEIIPHIKEILSDGVVDSEEMEDLLWLVGNFSEHGKYYDIITQSIQALQGLCYGLLADDSLSEDEVLLLIKWIDENDFLDGTYPYDEIKSLLSSITSDGIITNDEILTLKAFLSEFVNCETSYNISQVELSELKDMFNVTGVCAANPRITIVNHTFCFTGKSSRTTRSEIADLVEEHHGVFNNSVVKTTDYLIVGDEGNPCWAYSCYGRKVEKAVEMRKLGGKIMIVHENDFWKALHEQEAIE